MGGTDTFTYYFFALICSAVFCIGLLCIIAIIVGVFFFLKSGKRDNHRNNHNIQQKEDDNDFIDIATEVIIIEDSFLDMD
jgi:cadmium resistance protein CadD (predicted permease)